MAENKPFPRTRAIYDHFVVNLAKSNLEQPKLVGCEFVKGKIDAIPHNSVVQGYLLRGVFYIEKWYHNNTSIINCVKCN